MLDEWFALFSSVENAWADCFRGSRLGTEPFDSVRHYGRKFSEVDSTPAGSMKPSQTNRFVFRVRIFVSVLAKVRNAASRTDA
jgi:hypothetical protein